MRYNAPLWNIALVVSLSASFIFKKHVVSRIMRGLDFEINQMRP